MHSFPDKLSPRERLIATVGALMVVMLVMLAFARPSAAQVYVVTPDADRLPASVATTMMLDPLQLLQGLDVSDVHAIPHPRGGEMLSHPELGFNILTARVLPNGSLAVGCRGATEEPAGSIAKETSR